MTITAMNELTPENSPPSPPQESDDKGFQEGIPPRRACEVAMTTLLSDEKPIQGAIGEIVSAVFP